VLLALLVWAVIHTANKSSRPPRTRGIRPVVRHVVDVHDELDVEHERYGAECPNQPGQPGRDWAARVDGRRSRRPETTTDTPTTNPYPTTTPNNASHI
jgi:hypothetical protein